MSKKFYVLYSLVQTFTPQIFKAKTTVIKHTKANSNLSFKQFRSQFDALSFVEDIEDMIAELNSTHQYKLKNQQNNHIQHKSNIQTKNNAIKTLKLNNNQVQNIQQQHKNYHPYFNTIINSNINNQKSIDMIKKIIIKKNKNENQKDQKQQNNDKIFQFNISTLNQNAIQRYSSDTIQRIKDYLVQMRSQSERLFYLNQDLIIKLSKNQYSRQKIWRNKEQNQKNQVQVKEKNKVIHFQVLQDKRDQIIKNLTNLGQIKAQKQKIEQKVQQKQQNQIKQEKSNNQLNQKNEQQSSTFNAKVQTNLFSQISETNQVQIKQIQGKQQNESKVNQISQIKLVQIQQLQIKQQNKSKRSFKHQFKYDRNDEQQKLYDLMRKQVPFYQINPLISEICQKINNYQNIQIRSNVNRRQNPGYAQVNYSIICPQTKKQFAQRKIRLGMQKCKQDQINGLACILNDLYFSGIKQSVKIGIKNQSYKDQLHFDQYQTSIDQRIRKASSLLQTVKQKLKNQTSISFIF